MIWYIAGIQVCKLCKQTLMIFRLRYTSKTNNRRLASSKSELETACNFSVSAIDTKIRKTGIRIPIRPCRWFLDNPKFHEWRDNECSSLIWVSANPGCVKSVLSRSLVDKVLLTSNTQDATICYFFFKDISIQSRSITKALAAIIHQRDNECIR